MQHSYSPLVGVTKTREANLLANIRNNVIQDKPLFVGVVPIKREDCNVHIGVMVSDDLGDRMPNM
jgi:hypothetical protein